MAGKMSGKKMKEKGKIMIEIITTQIEAAAVIAKAILAEEDAVEEETTIVRI
jgi:hypothetical protein